MLSRRFVWALVVVLVLVTFFQQVSVSGGSRRRRASVFDLPSSSSASSSASSAAAAATTQKQTRARRATPSCLCGMPRGGGGASANVLVLPSLLRVSAAVVAAGGVCNCTLARIELVNAAVVAAPLEDVLRARHFAAWPHAQIEGRCTLWKDEGMCVIRECAVEAVDARGNVNLLATREQFTGYDGDEPRRIWRGLYESCSALGDKRQGALATRLVSGVHASINSHIAFRHLLNRTAGAWGADVELHHARVSAYPARVRNLAFVYLVVLSALHRAADVIAGLPLQRIAAAAGVAGAAAAHGGISASAASGDGNDDGDDDDDPAVSLKKLLDLLATSKSWPSWRDTTLSRLTASVHAGKEQDNERSDGDHGAARAALLDLFGSKAAALLDCVGCDRCRLWGKLQFSGVHTALQILFAPDVPAITQAVRGPGDDYTRLVALVNTLGRLSNSLQMLTMLRPLQL